VKKERKKKQKVRARARLREREAHSERAHRFPSCLILSLLTRNSRFRASFSEGVHSRARRAGTVNIQTDHMPMRRAMDGSSDGASRLKARRPPTAADTQAWTPKMVYRVDPLKAGFLPVAPEARGAKVEAVLRTRRETWEGRERVGSGFFWLGVREETGGSAPVPGSTA